MSANVTIIRIRGIDRGDLPMNGRITVRGHRKGKSAKPCKCMACEEEIAVGEQYIRCGGEFAWMYCLGCAEFE